MNLNRVFGAVIPVSFLILQPLANATMTLVTGPESSYWALSGGGGELPSTLNGEDVDIFCVDFANSIAWSTDYTANVTLLTSGNLSLTRFGNVTSFNDNFAGTGVSVDSTDQTTLNNTEGNPLARYEMAAYLTETYQYSGGNNGANDGIQQAIWDLLDPVGDPNAVPNIGNPTSALEAAAQWYSNPESDKSFLSNFVIISDPSMTACSPSESGALCGGFQEQLAFMTDPPTSAPEPRGQALIVLAFLSAGGLLARRFSRRSQASEKPVS